MGPQPPSASGFRHVGRRRTRAAWRAAKAAATEYREALDPTEEQRQAHLELARVRFPGPDYVDWLTWLHRTLEPATYLEIGVAEGRTLALARPPTLAIGVDPSIGLEP